MVMEKTAKAALAGLALAGGVLLVGTLGSNWAGSKTRALETQCRAPQSSASAVQPHLAGQEEHEFQQRYFDEVIEALKKADASGDVKEARRLAAIASKLRVAPQSPKSAASGHFDLSTAKPVADFSASDEIPPMGPVMDVSLPDGTLVRGVPVGIARNEFLAKVRRNGFNVPDDWRSGEATLGQGEVVPAWARDPLICDARELARGDPTNLVGIQRDIVEAREQARDVKSWSKPIAAAVFGLSLLPWLWYFLLQRIRELREALVGK